MAISTIPILGSHHYSEMYTINRHIQIRQLIVTYRPKSFTFSQSVATKVRLRSEKRVLKYALRQNKYVAIPPLAI